MTYHKEVGPRDEKFIAGVIAGKSYSRAALDAGFPKDIAAHAGTAILGRPQNRARMRELLAAKGFDPERAAESLVNIVFGATTMIVDKAGVEHFHPDFKTRLAATELAMRAWGELLEDVRIDVRHDGSIQVVHLQAEDGLGPRRQLPEAATVIDVTPNNPKE